jgi:hypothetical protein
MSTALNIPNCDVTILARIIRPDRGDLSIAAARAFLKLDFDDRDRERMHALLEKARAGTATHAELDEMDDYDRIAHLLGMIRSKARRVMKKRRVAP